MAKKLCYRCGSANDLEDVKEGKGFVSVCKDREKCMQRKLKSKSRVSMQKILGL